MDLPQNIIYNNTTPFIENLTINHTDNNKNNESYIHHDILFGNKMR